MAGVTASRTTRSTTHGGRCSAGSRNPNNKRYADYGGRGITVCMHWHKDGFPNFLADMGERPEGTTLDRINNDGDYGPDQLPRPRPAGRQPAPNGDVASTENSTAT